MIVTLKDFLDVITHGRTDEAWLTAVPNIADSPPGYWFGMRYREFAKTNHDEDNIYYALGLIKGGQRTLDNWAGGTLIALDDVGEKSGEASAVRDALGDPTFVVQTSKGSQQWGYVLNVPILDPTIMGRLQRALTLKFYPKQKDPGHERIVQYLRLPSGVNNKPARLAENNGQAQAVTLAEWRPEVRLDPLDVMMALEGAWELTEHMSLSASGLTGPATEEAARQYLSHDRLLIGLDMAGMVDWGRITNGYIGCRCPWEAEHTGVKDDRAGYNPDMGHFQCFHGSHGPKSPDDLHRWLVENVGERYTQMRYDMAVKAFSEVPLTCEAVEKPEPEWLVSILKSPPATPLPARKAICSHLARGEVTYRIGAPGIGKSALALAYAAALAYEKPELAGEAAFARLGDVLIISNEDSADDYRKRLQGWRKVHNLLGVEPKHDIRVTTDQSFRAIVRPDRYSDVELGDDMAKLEAWIKRLNNPCLVILDTQAATFRGVEENDNAAMGAAMAMLANWAKRLNVSVEVIHHGLKANGSTEGGGRLTSARGAGAAGGSVRNALTATGLTDVQMDKLPPGEGREWVKETGAKSNHSDMDMRKWWRRVRADVAVHDPDMVDGDGNVLPQTQQVPVYVFHEKGPKIIFDPKDPETLLQVVTAVAEAERQDTPFRLSPGNNGLNPYVADVIADAQGWERKEGKRAVDAARDDGLIENVPWRNPATRKEVTIWSATAKGLALLSERENVLETLPEEGAPGV